MSDQDDFAPMTMVPARNGCATNISPEVYIYANTALALLAKVVRGDTNWHILMKALTEATKDTIDAQAIREVLKVAGVYPTPAQAERLVLFDNKVHRGDIIAFEILAGDLDQCNEIVDQASDFIQESLKKDFAKFYPTNQLDSLDTTDVRETPVPQTTLSQSIQTTPFAIEIGDKVSTRGTRWIYFVLLDDYSQVQTNPMVYSLQAIIHNYIVKWMVGNAELMAPGPERRLAI